MWTKVQALVLAAVFAAGMTAFAQKADQKGSGYSPDSQAQHITSTASQSADEGRISREVRHQILMQPYYSVFDDIGYRVDGNAVTLVGAVNEPWVKKDVEASVKKIEGVDQVNDQIQVLPPSPMDDQIRREEFRTIYGTAQLQKYAWSAVQSIHIIVNGGHVTLTGVVARDMDKQIADTQAKSVPGVFSVTDNLKVENPGK